MEEKELREIVQDAKRVKETYDYMDSLPLPGWFWEIIRRTPEYKAACNELVDLLKAEKRAEKEYRKTFRRLREMGVDISSGSLNPTYNREVKGLPDEYLDMMERNYHLFPYDTVSKEQFPTKVYGDGSSFDAVPKPEKTYADFTNYQKPIVFRKTVQCMTYNEFFESAYTDSGDPVPIEVVLIDFAVDRNPFDSLYLAVSLTASLNEVEEEIKEILRQHLSSRGARIRSDKWKLYLITYDLKKEGKKEPEIGSILTQAFPPERQKDMEIYDDRTVINYYKNALNLLKGEYKKFLTIPVF